MPGLVESGPHTADTGGVGLSANSFAEIYGQHMPEITRYCRSILHNRDDAEDAAQNAMERALKALSDGPAPDRMRPWLFTIAHRESVNVLRRRRRSDVQLDESSPAPQGSPEELSAVRERLAELLADLQELAPRQRQVLVARELGGRSYRDIARDLGTSEAAAQQVVLEARRSLRQFEAGRSLECDDVQSWISAHDQARVRTRRVRAHLRACGSCRGFQQGIHGRRRDFGLLLPGIGGSGSLWGAMTALLGEGGAKIVTAGAVVAAGATLAGTAVELESRDAPAPRPVRSSVRVAVAEPTAGPVQRTARAKPGTTIVPRGRRRASRTERGGDARPPGASVPAIATAQPSEPDRASDPAEPRPTATAPSPSDPQPTSTPAPAPNPAEEALQPVLEAVPPVVEEVGDVVDGITGALPPAPAETTLLP